MAKEPASARKAVGTTKPAMLMAPVGLRATPFLLLLPLLHQVLPRLHDGLHVLLLRPREPHDALPEQDVRPILIVGSIDLTKVLRSVVSIVELKHLLSRNYRVEVAENKENGEVGVQSLHYCEVV